MTVLLQDDIFMTGPFQLGLLAAFKGHIRVITRAVACFFWLLLLVITVSRMRIMLMPSRPLAGPYIRFLL